MLLTGPDLDLILFYRSISIVPQADTEAMAKISALENELGKLREMLVTITSGYFNFKTVSDN